MNNVSSGKQFKDTGAFVNVIVSLAGLQVI
jgi:hypothetical protein